MCIATLQQLQFSAAGESLFGMFDGGTHAEVPQFVADNIADVLRSEVSRHQIPAHVLSAFSHQIPAKYMKHALLSMHRSDAISRFTLCLSNETRFTGQFPRQLEQPKCQTISDH